MAESAVRLSQAERLLGLPLLRSMQMHFDSYTSLLLEGKDRAICLCCGPSKGITFLHSYSLLHCHCSIPSACSLCNLFSCCSSMGSVK